VRSVYCKVHALALSSAETGERPPQKDICYFLPLAIIFWLVPFHFVVSMQRELRAGRHRLVLGLLAGHPLGVAPRGTIFIRAWVLALLLAVMAAVGVILRAYLFDHLLPAPYLNLFTNLIEVRSALYFAIGVECFAWYYRSLNELKRECLAVEKIIYSGV